MQGVTLTVAIFLSILVLVLRPRHALVVYIAGLIFYPSFLAVSIGTIDILLGRIIVVVLFIRCIYNDKLRSKFKWSKLDKWVIYSMVVYVGVTLITQPRWSAIENRGGFITDTWLAYMVGRFIITDRAELISVIKCIAVLLIPLAILGCVEAITGWQPFVPLRRFNPWNPEYDVTNVGSRWGFTRAIGPFSHPILFGGCFALFLPLIFYLRYEKSIWRTLAYILSAIAVIGSLSSMSSGPWIMIIVLLFCMILDKYRQYAKPMLILFVILCIAVEVLSNRPFYHVFFTYGGKLGGAGWHRAQLIDVAIKKFGEWWLAGYGGKDPGWGHYFGMGHTDVTNEYILAGVRYGIAGVIALCGVFVVAFKGIVSAYKEVSHPVLKSMYWALGSLLFSVVVVWTSVSFFGQLMPLFYCILGIIGSSILFPTALKRKQRKVVVISADKVAVLSQNTH